jgi:hypothetical protein
MMPEQEIMGENQKAADPLFGIIVLLIAGVRVQ